MQRTPLLFLASFSLAGAMPRSRGRAGERRFELGTPNLLVVTGVGTLVNADTATTWRNAASRSEDAIYEELVGLAG